jgi:RNase H-fold protein (predicted Holliday junction resolvase)
MLREARESGIMTRRVRKEDVDSRAACLIAEQWMNAKLDEDPPN